MSTLSFKKDNADGIVFFNLAGMQMAKQKTTKYKKTQAGCGALGTQMLECAISEITFEGKKQTVWEVLVSLYHY